MARNRYVARTCLHCGVGYQARVDSDGKYCSRRCYFKSLVGRSGEAHNTWKGGRKLKNGRPVVYAPKHPRAHNQGGRRGGYVFEHILVAEKALGKFLPAGAVVHHVNGDVLDNRPQNLVICQDQPYHLLIHRRARQLVAGKELAHGIGR